MDLSSICIVQIIASILFLGLGPQSIFAQNKIIFERFTCPPSPKESKVQSLYCNVKRISRDNLKIYINANVTKPVNGVLIHVTFYYKFNGIVYNKYPIDLWENVCDYLDGKSMKSYMLDWLIKGILQYTNLNHSCPYIGYTFVKADNVSIDTFSFAPSLIPSGSYRVDFTGTESDRVVFAAAQMYFSVSDHRIEVV